MVTQKLISHLSRRGVRWLYAEDSTEIKKRPSTSATPVAPGDAEPPVATAKTNQLDEALEHELVTELTLPNTDRLVEPAKGLSLQNLREEIGAGKDLFRKTIIDFANIATDMIQGKMYEVDVATGFVKDFVDLLHRDPSLPMLISEMTSVEDDYLFSHGLNVALITMAVVSKLGCPDPQVLDASVGALFQDVGMLKVPRSIRLAPRGLTPEEWSEIQRHPILTVDTLERVHGLSQTSFMVAYQSHERCDKSGYPRHRHQQYIHPMARIAAAADTFVAVTCPRPHRAGATPHAAIKVLLREAAGGKLDKPIVRNVLDTIAIFPVGSYVRLSDGTHAKVLRANGEDHKTPIVVPLMPDGSETDTELNLSKMDDLPVVATLEPVDLATVSPTADQPLAAAG